MTRGESCDTEQPYGDLLFYMNTPLSKDPPTPRSNLNPCRRRATRLLRWEKKELTVRRLIPEGIAALILPSIFMVKFGRVDRFEHRFKLTYSRRRVKKCALRREPVPTVIVRLAKQVPFIVAPIPLYNVFR